MKEPWIPSLWRRSPPHIDHWSSADGQILLNYESISARLCDGCGPYFRRTHNQPWLWPFAASPLSRLSIDVKSLSSLRLRSVMPLHGPLSVILTQYTSPPGLRSSEKYGWTLICQLSVSVVMRRWQGCHSSLSDLQAQRDWLLMMKPVEA